LCIRMNPDLLPPPASHPLHGRPLRRLRSFFRANGRFRTSVVLGVFILASLFLYSTFLSPHESPWRRPSSWHPRPTYPSPYADLDEPIIVAPIPSPTLSPSTPPAAVATPSSPPPSSPLRAPESDVLTLEQIRDIVTPTRGFFTRDYSLGLGWNNVSLRGIRFKPN
jgi:hypothetical protein